MFNYFGGGDLFKRGTESISQQTKQVAGIPADIQNKINSINLPSPVKDVLSRVQNLDPTGENSADNPWGY